MKTMLPEILYTAIKTALDAGKTIMYFYAQNISASYKADQSPVTEADITAGKLINEALMPLGFPIINEETEIPDYETRRHFTNYWLIDPLDGTKEFLKRNGEFSVNIAFIDINLPILGVIYLPAKQLLYFAEESIGSYKLDLSQSVFPSTLEELLAISQKLPLPTERTVPRIIGSRSSEKKETARQVDLLKQLHPNAEVLYLGSSLKFCLLAEGSADYYPRFSPCMEWDTAAGHAIAKYAGKTVFDVSTKNELLYNKQSLESPNFIVS
ncbi:MAG TPA: 3'(2'),5'-bisphosphate nucleotidase [Bacteroidales bacterium]|nr:3'(2'),5'-bisphosphate nucleotidase [Bacteroidales bacterium]